MSSSRQPAGIPVGGQFASQTHAETDVSLDVAASDALSPEERWAEMFTPTERSVLTRNGITAREWVDVAEKLKGVPAANVLLADAYHCHLTPHEATQLFEVTGGRRPMSMNAVGGLDFDRLADIPESMRPVDPRLLKELDDLDPGTLQAVGEAWPHVLPGVNDDPMRLRNTLAVVEAGVDASVAAETGSGSDWHRARLVQDAGLDPAVARAYTPCYPVVIDDLVAGGWQPEDIPGVGRPESADAPMSDEAKQAMAWARAHRTKAQQQEWADVRVLHHMDAAPFIDAGVGPVEASEWVAKTSYPGRSRGVAGDIAAYKMHNVTPDQAQAAEQAGLRLGPDAPELIARMSASDIASWAEAFSGNGGRIDPATISGWQNKIGVDDPVRASKWLRIVQGAPAGDERLSYTHDVVRFIHEHMDPEEVEAGTHPIMVATSRKLGVPLDTVRERVGDKRPVPGCRQMFSRRRLDTPF